MTGLGPVAVVVRVELTPAQLATIRTDVREQLVDLVTGMAGDDLVDLVRDTVYRVIREDMNAAIDSLAADAATAAADDPAIAQLDGATRAPIAPDDQTGPRPCSDA